MTAASSTTLTDLDVGAMREAELTVTALHIAAEQGRLASLQAAIAVRLTEVAVRPSADGDEWLDARAAAVHLGVPQSWVRDKVLADLRKRGKMDRTSVTFSLAEPSESFSS